MSGATSADDATFTAGLPADNSPGIDAGASGTPIVGNAWSTGTYIGDGNQASHGKDNALWDFQIGIMEPIVQPPVALGAAQPRRSPARLASVSAPIITCAG